MTVFGLYVVQSGVRGNGSGDALSRSALALILTGNLGWVMSSGLLFTLAGAEDAAGPVAQAVFAVRSGITLVSSVAVALGFGLFAVALSTREDFNKIAALIVAAVSIVSLLGFIIAISDSGMARTAITIARACYLVWVVWSVSLGIRQLKQGMPASA